MKFALVNLVLMLIVMTVLLSLGGRNGYFHVFTITLLVVHTS